eukprot:451154-Rhodomonas_salina.2
MIPPSWSLALPLPSSPLFPFFPPLPGPHFPDVPPLPPLPPLQVPRPPLPSPQLQPSRRDRSALTVSLRGRVRRASTVA